MKVEEIFIAHPKTSEQRSALRAFMNALNIKFEISNKENYDPEFIKKIGKSKEEYLNGDFVSVQQNELKNFLGIE